MLKRMLKDEYIDYCFWDIDIKPKMDKPLRHDETKIEQFPKVRGLHYTRIFVSVVLGVFFIASGIESMEFFRAICTDQIYEARCNEPDVILRYRDILAIDQNQEDTDFYIAHGNAGQEIYMSDDSVLLYVAQQSGLSIPKPE